MEVLTEMDEYFNAMSKINMDEPVMPYVKGRLVESDTYNKVQKILNTPELEKAHMYCYDLDLENLEECDITKINNLYKLGVDRGFIDDDLEFTDDKCCEKPEVVDANTQTEVATPAVPAPRAKIPCFVAMYSAMKDGQIKTGEAYSHAISVEAAKADVKAQLSKFGYSNISILAIEATEEDACACTVSEAAALGSKIGEDDMLNDRVHNGHVSVSEDDVTEDDMLDGRHHNNHIPEAEEEESAEDAGSEDDSAEDDSSTEDDSDSDSEDDSTESDDSAEDSSTEDDAKDDTEAEDTEAADDTEDASSEDDSADDTDSEDGDEEAEDDDSSAEEDADSEEAADDDNDDEELDDNKKADLKDNYKKIFKNTMLKCKFEDKSFDDLTLKEKVKFFTELSKTWKEDYEPSAFMSDKEIDQLNKIVVKK